MPTSIIKRIPDTAFATGREEFYEFRVDKELEKVTREWLIEKGCKVSDLGSKSGSTGQVTVYVNHIPEKVLAIIKAKYTIKEVVS